MTPFNILEIIWGILVCFFYMFEGLVRYVNNHMMRILSKIHLYLPTNTLWKYIYVMGTC